MEKKLKKLDKELSPSPYLREKLIEALDSWEGWNLAEKRHLPRMGGWEDQEWEWHRQIGCVGGAKRKADAKRSAPDS